jgi:RimJ/RimL family protein N-acetyltransferase
MPDDSRSLSTAPAEIHLRDGDLLLRPPRIDEAALYASWWADEEVCWGFCSEPRTAEQIAAAFPELEAEARDIGHWIDFVIEVEGQPVGYLWFSHWDLDAAAADLNILIGEPEHRRRGLARRAIRLACAWAFPTMELQRIVLAPREDHVPAIRSYLGAGARIGEIQPDVVAWRGESVCFRELYYLPEDFPGPPTA